MNAPISLRAAGQVHETPAAYRLVPVGKGRAEILDADRLKDPALVATWTALAELREDPFLTPQWYQASIEARGEDPYPIAWSVKGEFRGFLPLVRKSRGPLKLLCFPGSRRGDWFTPVCAPSDERAMAEACADALLRESRSWQVIRLDRVDSTSAFPDFMTFGGGLSTAPTRRRNVLPYIEFDAGGYESYLGTRSRNFRSQLHRHRARLEREYGLSFRLTSSQEELQDDLDAFWQLHDDRWHDRGGSTLSTAAARRHLELFAKVALDQGWLRLWTAIADGRSAATWFGWRLGDRYCYSLSGFDRRYQHHSIGTVMLAHTIEQAAAEGATVYDLMWGDEMYKRRFETGRRYATTWLLSRNAHPVRPVLSLGMRAVRAADGLQPRFRRPLGRMARATRLVGSE